MSLKEFADTIHHTIVTLRSLPCSCEIAESIDREYRDPRLNAKHFWVAWRLELLARLLDALLEDCRTLSRCEWKHLDELMNRPSRHEVVTLISRIQTLLHDFCGLESKSRDDFDWHDQDVWSKANELYSEIYCIWQHIDFAEWPNLIRDMSLCYFQIRAADRLQPCLESPGILEASPDCSLKNSPSVAGPSTASFSPTSGHSPKAAQATPPSRFRGRLRVLRENGDEVIELDCRQYSVNSDAYRLFADMIAKYPHYTRGNSLDPPVRPSVVDRYLQGSYPQLASLKMKRRGAAIWQSEQGRGCRLLIDPNSPAIYREKSRDI